MLSNQECPKCGYNSEGIHVIPVSVDTEYFRDQPEGGHLAEYECPECGEQWSERIW